jgi:hypothetical protein
VRQNISSLTPYSEHTRALIKTTITEFIDRNRDSPDQCLRCSPDGSVDLYVDPNDS